jgi:1,4-alpha-glucan branching enzyme
MIRLSAPLILLIFILAPFTLPAQVVTSDKDFPAQNDEVIVTFFADRGDQGLKGYAGDVYAHTGVITSASTSPSDWKYTKTNWNQNTPETRLTRIDTDVYQLSVSPTVMDYYGIPGGETVLQLAFVFRNHNGSVTGRDAGGADIFLDLYPEELFSVKITSPPQPETILSAGALLDIEVVASTVSDMQLFIDDDQVASGNTDRLTYSHTASLPGQYWIWVKADDGETVVYDSVYYFALGDVPEAALPEGVIPGVNYIDDHSAIIVLHDPPALKEFVFLTGDFNDWMPDEDYLMNRTPEGDYFWSNVSGLDPDVEYAYQFFIDGELKLADPYTHKVLDPWHDQWISSATYPDLKPYPSGKTTGIVSILHINKPEYEWQVTDFTPPDIKDLVIYELLIRDFVSDSDIKTVLDSLDYLQSLGINAIELMPVNQFEGNDSWGYNPSFYFAADKAYGRMNDYKRFIDECHKRGIAVILDMVLNHSFGQSPLVQMYFDAQAGPYGNPSPDNPWYNEVCPHPPWCWGYDFDHESPYTQEFVDRVNRFWLEEFRIDGFRFDFTKGFTNDQTGNQGANYDASRVAILKRMADRIWEVNDKAYVILEHFAENAEEKELAGYGKLLWGNMNYHYNEATMGYISGSNLSGASYKTRGWDVPHLVSYMESHDEERLMYKNHQWGNSAPGYDTRQTGTALRRMEQAAVFYFTIPGPKMIWQFGELGYDYSINHCPDGTVSEACRTARKPVRWDYYDDWSRKRLYDVYSMLIDLKLTQPVFGTDDFSYSLGGVMKRIHLNHAGNNVTVLGNFGVTEGTVIPHFQETGAWYEFFSRHTLQVDDVTEPLLLQPGEYRLYSTAEFPDHGIPLSSPPVFSGGDFSVRVYPNPSRGDFQVGFELQQPENVAITIYNIQGKKLRAMADRLYDSGLHNVYSGHDPENRLPGGIYILEIVAGEQRALERIVIF